MVSKACAGSTGARCRNETAAKPGDHLRTRQICKIAVFKLERYRLGGKLALAGSGSARMAGSRAPESLTVAGVADSPFTSSPRCYVIVTYAWGPKRRESAAPENPRRPATDLFAAVGLSARSRR